MRSIVLLLFVLAAGFATAQLPSFSSTERRSEISEAAQQKIGAEFRDFESVIFDQTNLVEHLQETQGLTDFQLQLGSHNWIFELEPFDIRGEDYVVRVQDENGIRELPKGANISYRGQLKGVPNSEIRLVVSEEIVYGLVAQGKDAVFFQSQWLNVPSAASNELLIFEGSDGIVPDRHSCGTDEALHSTGDHEASKAQASRAVAGDCYEVELAIASDWLMYQAYGQNATALEARNLGVMASVGTDYSGTFADNYLFVVVEQFLSTCSTCDPWTSSTSASALLNSFTAWGNNGFQNDHDLGQLWSDRQFAGSTIGVAWLGAVCTGSRYHVLEDFTSNADLIRVLVSHEIGHNFNMQHDGSGTPFIMAPAVQNTVLWSNSSINAINSFGPTRNCLSSFPCGGGTTPPIADFTSTSTNICEGQTVTFTDLSTGALTYNWTFPGGTPATSTSPNPTVTYNFAGTYDVILTVDNAFGSDTKTEINYITVNPLPTASFVSTLVSPLNYQFTNLSSGGVSYQWSFGDGNISSDFSPTHAYAAPGSYTVILTAFNSCGAGTDIQVLDVIVPPVASFTSTNPEGCAPLTINYQADIFNNGDTYSWTFPGGNPSSSTIANPVIVYTQPGSYDVTLVVTNALGTDQQVSAAYVTVLDSPTAGFSASVSGNTVSITNTSSGATSYSYNFGDGTTSTLAAPSHTYSIGGTYTISQTVTNSCGSETTNLSVTIDSAPVASFTVQQEACINDPVVVTSTSTGSPTSILFRVTRPDGTSFTETTNSFTFIATQRGGYDIELTVSNASGQNTTNQANAVTVLSVPTATFSFTLSGLQANFTGSVSPVRSGFTPTYQWNFGDGSTGTGATSSHTYSSSGSYTVVLTANNGCETTTFTQQITVGNAPTATISSNAANPLCPGNSVIYTANVSGNATSITWTLPGASPSSATGSPITVSYPQAGSFAVTVEVCNAVGCNTQTLTGGVTVQPAVNAGFTFTLPGGLQASFASAASGATSISYDFGDGSTSTQANTSHTYAAPGTYTVQQTASGPCGTDVFSATVTVGQAPVAQFGINFPNGALCSGSVIDFVDQSTGGVTTYAWSFPGGTPATSSAANPSVTYNTPGTYSVTLVASNSLGSSTSTQTNAVTILAAPTAGFTYTVNGFAVAFTNQSSNASSYNWNFGDGSSSTQTSPSHTYIQNGTYQVTLTSTGACGTVTSTQSVTIDVVLPPSAAIGVGQSAGVNCPGTVINYTSQSTGSITNYAWTFPGGTPSTSNVANPVVTYNSSGTFGATLTVSNSAGSSTATNPNPIIVQPLPTSAFTFTTSQLTVNFTNQATNATSTSWSFGDGEMSTASSPTHTYTQSGTYTVTLTSSNACGSMTTTQTVDVVSEPVAGFTQSATSGCEGLSVSYAVTNPSARDTYAWTFPGGSPATSTLASPTVRYSTAGTYSVTLVVTNSSGRDEITKTNLITITGAPVASFLSDVAQLNVQFTNTSSGATSSVWSFGDGSTSAAGSPSHTYSAAGSYIVTLTATNACGTTTAQQTVTVAPGLPNANFSLLSNSGCAPFSTTASAAGSTAADSYTWTFVGGTPSTATGPQAQVAYSASGIYPVQLIVTNATGSDTLFLSNAVTVLDVPMLSVLNPVISGNSVTLEAMLSGATLVDWSFGDGSGVVGGGLTQTHEYAEAGIYEAIATASNSCGTTRDTVIVNIGFAPDTEFSASVLSGCAPLEVQLLDNSTGSPTSWEWTVTSPSGEVQTSTLQNPSFVLTEVGSYSVSLQATNSFGSTTEVSVNYIRVLALPTANIDVTSQDMTTVNFSSAGTVADSVSWNFGDGSVSSIENPVYTYASSGLYQVVLTAFGVCGTSIDTLSVQVQSSGVNNLPEGASFALFPNPAREYTSFELLGIPSQRVTVEVVDAIGRIVYREQLGQASAFRQNLPVDKLAYGAYVVRIVGESFSYNVQLMKQ